MSNRFWRADYAKIIVQNVEGHHLEVKIDQQDWIWTIQDVIDELVNTHDLHLELFDDVLRIVSKGYINENDQSYIGWVNAEIDDPLYSLIVDDQMQPSLMLVCDCSMDDYDGIRNSLKQADEEYVNRIAEEEFLFGVLSEDDVDQDQ
jgi:hypothetical protein